VVGFGGGRRASTRPRRQGRARADVHPEFRNRLDATVQFGALTAEVILQVVDKEIAALRKALEDKKVTLEVTAEARGWLGEHGYDPAFGRAPDGPSRRDHAEEALAEALLFGALAEGGRLLPGPAAKASGASVGEAHFSPGEACRARIMGLLDGARASADICVFTITDDSISERIVAAHRRGVSVRVITDNEKSLDEGSDARGLERVGVAVRVDRSEAHMHHKYAIFDEEVLLTGSYNWTRSAALYNRENLVVTREARLVVAFGRDFETLWGDLERWSSS
jgi:phosphatidylserine/phosphatidylglycerophosphate/cardiolipin synthase-like enzyme